MKFNHIEEFKVKYYHYQSQMNPITQTFAAFFVPVVQHPLFKRCVATFGAGLFAYYSVVPVPSRTIVASEDESVSVPAKQSAMLDMFDMLTSTTSLTVLVGSAIGLIFQYLHPDAHLALLVFGTLQYLAYHDLGTGKRYDAPY